MCSRDVGFLGHVPGIDELTGGWERGHEESPRPRTEEDDFIWRVCREYARAGKGAYGEDDTCPQAGPKYTRWHMPLRLGTRLFCELTKHDGSAPVIHNWYLVTGLSPRLHNGYVATLAGTGESPRLHFEKAARGFTLACITLGDRAFLEIDGVYVDTLSLEIFHFTMNRPCPWPSYKDRTWAVAELARQSISKLHRDAFINAAVQVYPVHYNNARANARCANQTWPGIV
jgi:hypothetical protein